MRADIKVRLRRSAEDIVAIGQRLIEAKARLGHGQFLKWIEAEFGMSEATARRFRQVAKTFDPKSVSLTHLDPDALYALAAPTTPDEARAEVEQRLTVDGETLSVADVKAIIAAKKKAEGDRDALKANFQDGMLVGV